MVAALTFEREQLPLDRADGRLRHIAIFGREFVGVLGAPDEHRLQIAQIEQQQILFVGDPERDREHAFLHFVEAHQPREQQRAHFGDGGADRVPLFAEQVPEDHRIVAIGPCRVANFGGALRKRLMHLGGRTARHRHAGEVALYVGDEHRDAHRRKALGEALQGHRLAGAGRTGDQPVTVRAFEHQRLARSVGRPAAAKTDIDFARRAAVAHPLSSVRKPFPRSRAGGRDRQSAMGRWWPVSTGCGH